MYGAAIDSPLFLTANTNAFKYAKILNDSIAVAGAFWDRGLFFSEIGSYRESYSAYQRASDLYLAKDKPINAARLLINMAILQPNVKDYLESEVTTIRVLKVLKSLGAKKYIYRCYNNLAAVYN